MDYQKMTKSSKRYIDKKERALTRLENHLENHPKDYQSKISLLLNKSQLEKERRNLSMLEYQAKIQRYREE